MPLVGAAIAGLFGRVIGDRAAQLVTCAALLIAAALSIFVFMRIGFGHEKSLVVPISSWIASGNRDQQRRAGDDLCRPVADGTGRRPGHHREQRQQDNELDGKIHGWSLP